MFELWTEASSNPSHALPLAWDLRDTDLCKKCLFFGCCPS